MITITLCHFYSIFYTLQYSYLKSIFVTVLNWTFIYFSRFVLYIDKCPLITHNFKAKKVGPWGLVMLNRILVLDKTQNSYCFKVDNEKAMNHMENSGLDGMIYKLKVMKNLFIYLNICNCINKRDAHYQYSTQLLSHAYDILICFVMILLCFTGTSVVIQSEALGDLDEVWHP